MSARGAERLVSAWRFLRAVARKFVADHGWILSSALAFNLLLYLVPLSLLMISLLGYTVLDSERAMREVQAVLRVFLPRSQEALAENLASVVANRGLLGFVGFMSFLMFSTFLFGSVRTVLNRIFQVRQERSLVHGIGVDILMVLFTALFILLAVGAAWFLALAGMLAEQYPSWSGIAQAGSEVFSEVFGVTATACLLYALYRFAPAATMSSRSLVIGSITGTALFQLAKLMFGWYVAIAQTNVEMYGALAGVTLLFVWLYYASLVFIIGAEVGWAYDQEQAKVDRSRPVA